MPDQISKLNQSDPCCDVWYIPALIDQALPEKSGKSTSIVKAVHYADQCKNKMLENRRSHNRTALHHIIEKYLSIPHRHIQIDKKPNGKPYVKGDSSGLYFNLSYSEKMAVLAVSNVEVGVDIEHIDTSNIDGSLLSRITSPAEEKSLIDQSSLLPVVLFHHVWTIKESVSKNTGHGLSFDFQRLDTSKIKSPGDPVLIDSQQSKFAIYRLIAPDNYIASLALAKQTTSIKYFTLSTEMPSSRWGEENNFKQIYHGRSFANFWT